MSTWAAVWGERRGRPVLFGVFDNTAHALALAAYMRVWFGLRLFLAEAPWMERPACPAARLAPAPDARAPMRIGLERRTMAKASFRADRGRRAGDLSLVQPLERGGSRARALATFRGVPVRLSHPGDRAPRDRVRCRGERERL